MQHKILHHYFHHQPHRQGTCQNRLHVLPEGSDGHLNGIPKKHREKKKKINITLRKYPATLNFCYWKSKSKKKKKKTNHTSYRAYLRRRIFLNPEPKPESAAATCRNPNLHHPLTNSGKKKIPLKKILGHLKTTGEIRSLSGYMHTPLRHLWLSLPLRLRRRHCLPAQAPTAHLTP